jgi:hypothetical protein
MYATGAPETTTAKARHPEQNEVTQDGRTRFILKSATPQDDGLYRGHLYRDAVRSS